MLDTEIRGRLRSAAVLSRKGSLMKRWLAVCFLSGGLWSCGPTQSGLCIKASDCVAPETCVRGYCSRVTPKADGGIEQDAGSLTPEDSNPVPGLEEADAGTNTAYDGKCGPPNAGNPPIRRLCAKATPDECDGVTDSALTLGKVPANRLNGGGGNGFDDDCDGLVDEGCTCNGSGATKTCYLVPATQVDAVSGVPVGWCASNTQGSLDCSGGEFGAWSGVCRGAQLPRLSDTCSAGDFNCDGLEKNNALEGCNCPVSVTCPTKALTLAPYPDPKNLTVIDGTAWISDAAKKNAATDWTWTVLGGDCDNVLPHPTFALYNQKDSTAAGAREGVRTPVKLDPSVNPPKYVASPGEPLVAMVATTSGTSGAKLYPAFGLSGDYVVQGEFKLEGQSYTCTQKVQVRAPGIRAELCWDSVGDNDIDLHVARLQGVSCSTQGWNQTCGQTYGHQDCFWNSESGCTSDAASGPTWGYNPSPDSACFGWSSKRSTAGPQKCTNPRLDKDTIRCDRQDADPTSPNFCGPENINLDNPKNGDRFVVGVNHYESYYNPTLQPNAKAHVNLYCNGERVLSAGYNPATGNTSFPLLDQAGQDVTGTFWTVATVKATVNGANQLTGCDTTPIPSRKADLVREGPANASGGANYCVDSAYSSKAFVEPNMGQGVAPGSQPTQPTQWCKH